MPLKSPNDFDISPNENIKYPIDTLFLFYDSEYFIKLPREKDFVKIVPWGTFHVENPVLSAKRLEEFPYGGVWIREVNYWKYLGIWTTLPKSPFTTTTTPEPTTTTTTPEPTGCFLNPFDGNLYTTKTTTTTWDIYSAQSGYYNAYSGSIVYMETCNQPPVETFSGYWNYGSTTECWVNTTSVYDGEVVLNNKYPEVSGGPCVDHITIYSPGDDDYEVQLGSARVQIMGDVSQHQVSVQYSNST